MTLKPIRLLREPVEGFGPSHLVPQQDFTSADLTERGHVYFADGQARVTVGVWEAAPSRETFDAYPGNEMMHILQGELLLTSPDGTTQTFVAGDMFFIPKGTPCIWEVKQRLRKFYMMAE